MRSTGSRTSEACIFLRLPPVDGCPVPAGVGDLVLRNVLFALVREAYPDARLTGVVGSDLLDRKGPAAFFRHHALIDDVLPCPSQTREDAAAWGTFERAVRARRFDACVVDFESIGLGAADARRYGIPARVGLTPFCEGRDLTHVAAVEQQDLFGVVSAYARALGIPRPLERDSLIPRLPFAPCDVDLPDGRPLVAIHVGGSREWNRRWPLAFYSDVAERLAARGAHVAFVGGAEESRLVEPAVSRLRSGGRAVVDATTSTLNELVNVLARADLFVGNDSGPLHIAAALRVPTVVPYGPSVPSAEGVYHRHRALSRDWPCRMLTSPVDAARVACEHQCSRHFDEGSPEYPRCLAEIPVDEVWETVIRELQASGFELQPRAGSTRWPRAMTT